MPDLPFPPLQPQNRLIERLRNTVTSNPHYEATWYGPYNAVLSHYFPYQQRFLIKPQPKLREAIAESLSEDSFSSILAQSSDAGDISSDTGEISKMIYP